MHVAFAPGTEPTSPPTDDRSPINSSYSASQNTQRYRSPLSREFFVQVLSGSLAALYEEFPGVLLAGQRHLPERDAAADEAAKGEKGGGFFDRKESSDSAELDGMIHRMTTEAKLVSISGLKR